MTDNKVRIERENVADANKKNNKCLGNNMVISKNIAYIILDLLIFIK